MHICRTRSAQARRLAAPDAPSGPGGSRLPAGAPVPGWRSGRGRRCARGRSGGRRGTPPRRESRRGRAAPAVRRARAGSGRRGSQTPVSSFGPPSASRSAAPRPVARPNCCASWPSRLSLCRSPRVRRIWLSSTPDTMKCWNSATMSANASWNACTSGLRRLVEARVHAVEQRVRRLVRDDVVRQAGEDQRARRVVRVLRA